MHYDATDPNHYLSLLEEDWRKDKLLYVRQLILSYAPELEESIRYKMLNFGKGESYVFALTAQKHYVSLYVGSIEKIDQSDILLADFNYGKGCIRIRKTIDIGQTELERFIQKTVDLWRAGEDIDC